MWTSGAKVMTSGVMQVNTVKLHDLKTYNVSLSITVELYTGYALGAKHDNNDRLRFLLLFGQANENTNLSLSGEWAITSRSFS